MESLVDREAELRDLRKLAAGGRPELLLLYGRRRIGKTYLLDQVWTREQAFYYLAADSTGELNRHELVRELGAWSRRDLHIEDFPTWRAVFRYFVQLARERPVVVILDEFQYLLEGDDDPASQLNAVWDRELNGLAITIVLCGSAVSIMEGLASARAPLYGRITWSAQLRAFDYFDAATMVHTRGRGLRELALMYGLFGGVPRYLAAVRPEDSLKQAATRAVVSQRGEVYLQLMTLIEQERGIRAPAEYRAVLSAIAAGRTVLNEIEQGAGMNGRTREVRRILDVLQQLELVHGEQNFAAHRTAAFRYRIADNALRFWYRFVERNRSRLERASPEEVWEQLIEPYLNDYMGLVFESICRQGYERFHRAWNLPAPVGSVQRWEGFDKRREAAELDFLARVEGDLMLSGEIKWRTRQLTLGEHHQLLDKLSRLALAGHSWAAEALAPNRSAGFIYFCAGGFDRQMTELAATDKRVHLVGLADLYRGLR